MPEAEVDGDRCDDFHRLTAEKRRFVLPCFHRFNYTEVKQRIALANDLQFFDRPIFGNHRLQYDRAFNMRRLC